jgi:AAA15 family ATPase/GTPase
MSELLRVFDAHVSDVSIKSMLGERPAIYLHHHLLGEAPLSVFGDAMRRSVLVASTLASLPAGGVLMIDEAEAGIHVEAQPKFFAWLMAAARQRQIQVFLTTHSLEALDAMLTGLPGSADETDLVVYQLKRDDAEIRCKRFAGDLLHRLRFERGLDVR